MYRQCSGRRFFVSDAPIGVYTMLDFILTPGRQTMWSKALAFGSLLAVSACTLSAQTGQASLNGHVKDPTGAVIPGVVVSAINQATNVSRSTVSNNEGIYSLPGLLPGMYRLNATFAGFRTLNREGVELRVGDRVSVDLVMEVGQQAE